MDSMPRKSPNVESGKTSSDFGFRARQYKFNIKRWKFDKNLSTADMTAMLRVLQTRRGIGKETSFFLRGQPVDPAKIERFRVRNGLSNLELEQAASESLFRSSSYFLPNICRHSHPRLYPGMYS
jgi:hypothetical protein